MLGRTNARPGTAGVGRRGSVMKQLTGFALGGGRAEESDAAAGEEAELLKLQLEKERKSWQSERERLQAELSKLREQLDAASRSPHASATSEQAPSAELAQLKSQLGALKSQLDAERLAMEKERAAFKKKITKAIEMTGAAHDRNRGP